MALQAKLIGWGPRVLYLGPAFVLTPHRNATAVLAIALDDPFDVASDPTEEGGQYRAARSALIPPNTLHHLVAGGRMAFLYLDPLSRDLAAISSRMRETTPRAGFDLKAEEAVIETMVGLADGHLAARDARQTLGTLLGMGARGEPDRRIAAALQQMTKEPHKSHSLAQWEPAQACRHPASCICSRPRPACRCDATDYGAGSAPRSTRSGGECR
jgi:hypothetical protein